MKRFVYLAFAMLMPGMLMAAPVKKDAAKMKAAAFLQQKIAATSGRRAPQNLSLTSSEEEGSAYYVFKNGNKGFAIVAGDDRFGDVIGYSEDGVLNEAQMPEALRLTLQDYAAAVKFAQENNIEVKKGPRKAERTNISHFVNFAYDQDSPYNNECPGAGDKTHCSLGCVAVATGMILSYYQFPKTMHEVLGYTSGAVTNEYLEPWDPDWKTTGGVQSLAKFLHYVANSLGTSYEEDGSGAKGSAFVPTMKGWGYSQNMRTIRRDSYSAEDWEDAIYAELAEQRPVYLYGYGNDVMGGHAYICDGYQASTGFYYINWGWGGTCNGWFDMAILNPFLQYFDKWSRMGYPCAPTGFTGNLQAVIGIQPAPEGEIVDNSTNVLTTDNFTASNSSISCWFYNFNTASYTGTVSWAILNDDGTFNVIESATKTTVRNLYESSMQTVNVNLSNFGLADGTYKIAPVCKTNEATEWSLCEGYRQKYADVTVVGDNITIIAHPVKNITVDGVYYQGVSGNYYEVIITFRNNGDDIFGNMYVTGEYNGTKLTGTSMSVAVKAGETQSVSAFIDKPGGSGTSNPFKVTVNYLNDKLWEGEISTPAMYTSDILYSKFVLDNYTAESNKGVVMGSDIHGYVELTADGSDFKLPVKITLKDDEGKEVYTTVQQYYVKNGETKQYVIDANNLAIGKTYTMFVDAIRTTRSYSTYTESTWKRFFGQAGWPIELLSGLYYYDEKGLKTSALGENVALTGDVAAVDVTTIDPVKVDFSGITNDNCIYLLKKNATIPAELDGKNVVVGGVAEKITLTDGKPVVFPVEFTADEISYTRIFEKGNNGDDQGWQTIVLPFNAKVTVDGNPQDWFHSKSENGLKFWLFKYTNGVGGTVYFDFETANTMIANEPYLIAVPGNKWGEKYNLTNKEFTFKGTNVTVKGNVAVEKKGGEYIFNGTYTLANFTNGYKLNEAGDFFELQTENATELPFRAYFANADESTSNAARVLRVARSETDGIVQMEIDELTNENQPIYNLNGQRMQQMKRGVNIVGGKKVLTK